MKLHEKKHLVLFSLLHVQGKRLTAVSLLLIYLLLGGTLLSCTPQLPSGEGRNDGQQRSSLVEAEQLEATGQNITFQVDQDGASKRITWVSNRPAENNMLICFEKMDNSIVICTDVEQGKISGILYAFNSMPVEECTAHFRPVQ